MNKKRIRAVLLAVILTAGCCLIPSSASLKAEETPRPAESVSRYRANDSLNSLRNALGLRTLAMDTALGSAAQAHTEYMYRALTSGQTERTDKEGFTGIEPLDRALYAGYEGQTVLEICSGNADDYEQMLTMALHDPAWRYCLLHPACTGIGYGHSSGYISMLFGVTDNLGWEAEAVFYPFAGQEEVGNCYLSRLQTVPDEVRMGSERGQIGEPVTFTYYVPNAQTVEARDVSFTLTDTKLGRTLSCTVILPQDSFQLPQTIIAYPLSLYLSDTRYEAHLVCTLYADGEFIADIDETWSYTSSGPDSIGEVSTLNALKRMSSIFEVSKEQFPANWKPVMEYTDYSFNPRVALSRQIYRMAEDGVLRPETNSALLPQEGVTRQQAAIWMMRMMRQYRSNLYDAVEISFTDTFQDINRCTQEGRDAVQRAYLMGLVSGQGGGMFSPDAYITETEFEAWMNALESLLAEADDADADDANADAEDAEADGLDVGGAETENTEGGE